MRVAVKFAYDGTAFHGYQRQPDVPTVEDEILRSLEKARIISDAAGSRFRSGSRTDRGVSALGNVLAFDTGFNVDELIPAHNAYAKNVWFHSVARVDDDFDPRIAKCRWYRYHLRRREDVSRLEEIAGVFVGEHDFASFTKDKDDTIRRVDSIDIRQEEGFTVIDVRGRAFLWQMVRRIVDAMDRYEQGDVGLDAIRAALDGERSNMGVAPPEPLFLMDTVYDFEFQRRPDALDSVTARLSESLFSANLRRMFFSRLARTGAGEASSE